MKLKILLIIFLFTMFSLSFVVGHGEEDFAEAEDIIMDKVDCVSLTEDDLEILGDYYMEQMHPGELHEIMDERMGGEGSESLRIAHINLGRAFYCGEHQVMTPSMMNIMMGRSGFGMRGFEDNNNLGYREINWIFMILIVVALVLIIVILVKNAGGRKK